MMDQRTKFLLQTLEKIGAPLTMAAVTVPEQNPGQDAQRAAELLNKSVQLGLTLAEAMRVRDESQADGVHLALTAFAGPLIAGQTMATGRVPGDLEIRRMSGALQAVLAFADRFTPAADTVLRLENNETTADPADETMIHVQMLNAFAPVLQAVSQYAFGRQEPKLIQEIGARITSQAADLGVRIFGADQPPRIARRIELVLVRLLAGIYAAAHMEEMARLMSLSDQDRNQAMSASGGVPMDPIWTAFNRRAEMVRVLAETIVPSPRSAAQAQGSGGFAPPPALPPVQQQPPAAPLGGIPGMNPPAAAAPVPSNEPPVSAGGNPMAFFSKKTADTDGQ